MDQSAEGFKSMKANVRQVLTLNVINEDTVSVGTTSLKRIEARCAGSGAFHLAGSKSVAVSGTKVEMYLPKIQTVQEYNLGKRRREWRNILALAFGASGSDLKADYTIKALG